MQNYLIIVTLNLLVYFRTLKYEYVSDDIKCSKERLPTKNWAKNLMLRLWGGLYWQTKEIEHLTHTLLHTLNCSLIYWVFGANTISLIAALLFAVNPANNQGAIWLSGRMYSRSTALVLIAFKFQFLFPVMYLWGGFICMNILPTPLMFIFTKHWYYIGLIPIFLSMLSLCGNSTVELRKKGATPIMTEISIRKLVLLVKSFTYYLRFSLFPYKLGFYHHFLYGFGISNNENDKSLRKDKYFWAGLVVIPVILACIITNFMNTAVGLMWFSVCISMWCNYPYTLHQSVAERYAYLPNAGLMLALANVIYRLPHPGMIFIAFFAAYITRLLVYMGAYKNYHTLLTYSLSDVNFKNHVTACILKGELESNKGVYYKALETWSSGLKEIPNDSRLHYYIASTLNKLGYYKEAHYHVKISENNLIKDINTPVGIDPAVKALKKQIEEKLVEKEKAEC